MTDPDRLYCSPAEAAQMKRELAAADFLAEWVERELPDLPLGAKGALKKAVGHYRAARSDMRNLA